MQQCDTVLDRVIHDHVPSVHHQRHLLMDADDTSPPNEGSVSTALNSALFACSQKADKVTVVGNQSSPRISGAAMELDQYHLLQDTEWLVCHYNNSSISIDLSIDLAIELATQIKVNLCILV